MKSPDEIKKGILCDVPCNECAYRERMMSDGGCGQAVTNDTIDYIQQLETERHQLLTKCERLERERDAAVKCIENVYSDLTRRVVTIVGMENNTKNALVHINDYFSFRWRGICEENTKEPSE